MLVYSEGLYTGRTGMYESGQASGTKLKESKAVTI